MIQTSVTIEQVIKLLNDALESDPVAMYELVEARVTCNYALANHPTIQVLKGDPITASDSKNGAGFPIFTVGLIGILNGIFGSDSDQWGTIAAEFDLKCSNDCELPEGHKVKSGPCPVCEATTVTTKLVKFVDLGRR